MYWSDFVANLQRPNYRYPILRNIGRSYRSTDVANISFRGEASSDLAISGGRGTQVLWSGQIVADISNGSCGNAESHYRYSRDQRSDVLPHAQYARSLLETTSEIIVLQRYFCWYFSTFDVPPGVTLLTLHPFVCPGVTATASLAGRHTYRKKIHIHWQQHRDWDYIHTLS